MHGTYISGVEGPAAAVMITGMEHRIIDITCKNPTSYQILLQGKCLDQVLGISYQKLLSYLKQHHLPSKAIVDAVSCMLEGQCVRVKFNCLLNCNVDEEGLLVDHVSSIQGYPAYLTASSIQLVGGDGCHTVLSYPPFSDSILLSNESSEDVPMVTKSSSFFSDESSSFFSDESSLLISEATPHHIDDDDDDPSLPLHHHNIIDDPSLPLHQPQDHIDDDPSLPLHHQNPLLLMNHYSTDITAEAPSPHHTSSITPRQSCSNNSCIIQATPELFSDDDDGGGDAYTPELLPQTNSVLKLKRTLYYREHH